MPVRDVAAIEVRWERRDAHAGVGGAAVAATAASARRRGGPGGAGRNPNPDLLSAGRAFGCPVLGPHEPPRGGLRGPGRDEAAACVQAD